MLSNPLHTLPSLLSQIASLQQLNGLFASYRKNKFWLYRRSDTNVFYTANIVFLLHELKSQLPADLQAKIEEISEKAITNYADFENKDGLKTYNFWKTKPSKHFPDGYLFRHFDHFRIPDDIDDTALVYLTANATKEQVVWLKDKLRKHANLVNDEFKVKNTFSHYQHLRVYSTWFGKNMPIEFDVCALCNLMYLVMIHDLPLNQHDEDTFTFLASVIERGEFLNSPFQVAHNYGTTPLIIYHYARLMGKFNIPILEKQRHKIIETAQQLLNHEKNNLNQIILETSLMRLGADCCFNSQFPTPNSQFHYFFAGLLSSYENPIARVLAPLRFFHIQWECPAHNLALVAENLALRLREHPKIGF